MVIAIDPFRIAVLLFGLFFIVTLLGLLLVWPVAEQRARDRRRW